MSGYNMEYFISDFADRTQKNLMTIDRIALEYNHLSNEKAVAFEVTQLINSFLGLVVLPNEKFKKWDKKKSDEMKGVEKKIWDLLAACEREHRYFNNYKDKNSKKVLEFIDHLRNSVSHSGKLGIHFFPVVEGGDMKITHIIFYDSDYPIRKQKNEIDAHRTAKEFCLKLTVDEAKQMVLYISDLYRLVERTSGRNATYETAISKLENLLQTGQTAEEGTVAEQFDKLIKTES